MCVCVCVYVCVCVCVCVCGGGCSGGCELVRVEERMAKRAFFCGWILFRLLFCMKSVSEVIMNCNVFCCCFCMFLFDFFFFK